jgi:hypothetical protein
MNISDKPVIFVCREYGSVPGIQWAMLFGRHAAEAVLKEFGQKIIGFIY